MGLIDVPLTRMYNLLERRKDLFLDHMVKRLEVAMPNRQLLGKAQSADLIQAHFMIAVQQHEASLKKDPCSQLNAVFLKPVLLAHLLVVFLVLLPPLVNSTSPIMALPSTLQPKVLAQHWPLDRPQP